MKKSIFRDEYILYLCRNVRNYFLKTEQMNMSSIDQDYEQLTRLSNYFKNRLTFDMHP